MKRMRLDICLATPRGLREKLMDQPQLGTVGCLKA